MWRRSLYLFEALVVLCFLAAPFAIGPSWGAGGQILWGDLFDNGGGDNVANAVVAKGKRVFVAGGGTTAAESFQWVVKVYDAKSGALLWDDKTGGEALAAAAKGKRVFVAGFGNGGWLVRAYHAKTGEVLWNDAFSDGLPQANAIAVAGHRVFAAGESSTQWLVRANNAKTGELLWSDQIDGAAKVAAAKGGHVFVAGQNSGGKSRVRAYGIGTGEVVWEDSFGSGFTVPNAIAVKGKRVFVVGVAQSEWFVRVYGAATGEVLWEDAFGHGFTQANAVAVKGKRVFAGGESEGLEAGITRAYDVKTGALLWEDRFGIALLSESEVNGLVTRGRRLFVAGRAKTDWVVRAHDVKSGGLLWEQQFTGGGNDNVANAIATKGNGVFAAGIGQTQEGDLLWAVEAYSGR